MDKALLVNSEALNRLVIDGRECLEINFTSIFLFLKEICVWDFSNWNFCTHPLRLVSLINLRQLEANRWWDLSNLKRLLLELIWRGTSESHCIGSSWRSWRMHIAALSWLIVQNSLLCVDLEVLAFPIELWFLWLVDLTRPTQTLSVGRWKWKWMLTCWFNCFSAFLVWI